MTYAKGGAGRVRHGGRPPDQLRVNGAADSDAFNHVALVPKDRTNKAPSDAKRKKLESLYAQVCNIRERKVGYERLGEIGETQ